mgnify:CR=1 FL=1
MISQQQVVSVIEKNFAWIWKTMIFFQHAIAAVQNVQAHWKLNAQNVILLLL